MHIHSIDRGIVKGERGGRGGRNKGDGMGTSLFDRAIDGRYVR